MLSSWLYPQQALMHSVVTCNRRSSCSIDSFWPATTALVMAIVVDVVDAIQQAVKLRFRISIAYPMSLSHLQWLNACATERGRQRKWERVGEEGERATHSLAFVHQWSTLINITVAVPQNATVNEQLKLLSITHTPRWSYKFERMRTEKSPMKCCYCQSNLWNDYETSRQAAKLK